MITLVVRLTTKVGAEEKTAGIFRQLMAASRTEPGCSIYIVNQSNEDPRRFLVYEQYTDEAALEAHHQTPHFKKYATEGIHPLIDDRQADLYHPLS